MGCHVYKGFSFLIFEHQNFRGAYLSHFSSILNDLKGCGCASRPLYFIFRPRPVRKGSGLREREVTGILSVPLRSLTTLPEKTPNRCN